LSVLRSVDPPQVGGLPAEARTSQRNRPRRLSSKINKFCAFLQNRRNLRFEIFSDGERRCGNFLSGLTTSAGTDVPRAAMTLSTRSLGTLDVDRLHLECDARFCNRKG